MKITLAHLDNMNVINKHGKTYAGGSQEWYSERFQRLSGCGPTAASNLIWYMTHSRAEQATAGSNSMEKYLELQNSMFSFVTPGMGGVKDPAVFADGITRYALEHGLSITPNILKIPAKPYKRPGFEVACSFLAAALQNGSPVAFLNLSNGTLKNLENWHWVTIIAVDTDTLAATICDQGNKLGVDLSAWLKTSVLGGAFVSI